MIMLREAASCKDGANRVYRLGEFDRAVHIYGMMLLEFESLPQHERWCKFSPRWALLTAQLYANLAAAELETGKFAQALQVSFRAPPFHSSQDKARFLALL